MGGRGGGGGREKEKKKEVKRKGKKREERHFKHMYNTLQHRHHLHFCLLDVDVAVTITGELISMLPLISGPGCLISS